MQNFKTVAQILLSETAHFGFCLPKIVFLGGMGGGSPFFSSLIGIFIFLWLRSQCKNLKSYDTPFWGFNNGRKNKKSNKMWKNTKNSGHLRLCHQPRAAHALRSDQKKSMFRSTMIHNSISKSHRRDTTMAALLFSIVVVFLLCHTTRLALNIYEAVQVKWTMKLFFH